MIILKDCETRNELIFNRITEVARFLDVNYYSLAKWLNEGKKFITDKSGDKVYRIYYTSSHTTSNNLCFNCRKASNSGCSWSESFTPVEGWTATPTNHCYGGSYHITECPEFERD